MEILTHPTSSLQFSDIAKKILKEVQDSRADRFHKNPKPMPRTIHPTKTIKGKDPFEWNAKSSLSIGGQNVTDAIMKGTVDSELKFKQGEPSDSLPTLKHDTDMIVQSEKDFIDSLQISDLTRSTRLSDGDMNQFSALLKKPDKIDESPKPQEKTPDVLHSCIKVFSPLKTGVSITREDDYCQEISSRSKLLKPSVTFRIDEGNGNRSSKHNSKKSKGESHTHDALPLTPSPSASECSSPSVSPTDHSLTPVSLTEVTPSLPSSYITSTDSLPIHQTPPPLTPIENSLSSSSPPIISSPSCSISDFSGPPLHHKTSTHPDSFSSPDTSSSLPTPPENTSSLLTLSESSSSFLLP
ncbi:uncharacterized protein [Palaemon carinicauda]|uniref:uncharacterized protein n=1 Tax=Palaemon carinicauda TaxID=392227 RepID=UPI0035B656EF